MHLVKSAHCCRSHENMDNEVQRSPITLAKDDEAKGGRVESMHSESDSEL